VLYVRTGGVIICERYLLQFSFLFLVQMKGNSHSKCEHIKLFEPGEGVYVPHGTGLWLSFHRWVHVHMTFKASPSNLCIKQLDDEIQPDFLLTFMKSYPQICI
jgi:hypothetical protein